MTCSNAIIASLSEQDCVAVSAHIRMRRLLAAVDVMHGKFTPEKVEIVAKQQGAMFIHEKDTGDDQTNKYTKVKIYKRFLLGCWTGGWTVF